MLPGPRKGSDAWSGNSVSEFCICASMCVQTWVHVCAYVCVYVCVWVLPHVCVHASVSFPRSSASWWQITSCPFQALLYKHFNHIEILTELSLGLSPKFLGDKILSVGFSQILTSDTIRHWFWGGPCSPNLLPGPDPVDVINSPESGHSLEITWWLFLAGRSLCSWTLTVTVLPKAEIVRPLCSLVLHVRLLRACADVSAPCPCSARCRPWGAQSCLHGSYIPVED